MLRPMEERAQHERWVNPNKARYYQAHLCRDLFGEWILVKVWGGCGSSCGCLASTGVASYVDGVAAFREIGERRRARGYQRAG
jgi:hypothetical protein